MALASAKSSVRKRLSTAASSRLQDLHPFPSLLPYRAAKGAPPQRARPFSYNFPHGAVYGIEDSQQARARAKHPIGRPGTKIVRFQPLHCIFLRPILLCLASRSVIAPVSRAALAPVSPKPGARDILPHYIRRRWFFKTKTRTARRRAASCPIKQRPSGGWAPNRIRKISASDPHKDPKPGTEAGTQTPRTPQPLPPLQTAGILPQ